MVCKKCESREIAFQKHKLCGPCYQKAYKKGELAGKVKHHSNCSANTASIMEREKQLPRHTSELMFVKNMFDHQDWIPQPASFILSDGSKYYPDFYDIRRSTFIEVVGSRQAYHFNKKKYEDFVNIYKGISFEIRSSNGELYDTTVRAYNKKEINQEG